MVIFHCYVSSPEGTYQDVHPIPWLLVFRLADCTTDPGETGLTGPAEQP